MGGSSQVILGATLIMAANLSIVFGLVLVLLAELYCSLLLRRRQGHRKQQQLHNPAASATSTLSAIIATRPSSVNPSTPSPLSSFYTQGVLHAPRSLLFPALPSADAPKMHYGLSVEALESSLTPQWIGLMDAASPNFISLSLPAGITQEECNSFQFGPSTSSHLVYISNPMYNNDCTGKLSNQLLLTTPFETPDSSTSGLDSGSSSGADGERDDEVLASWTRREPDTPPLTLMKKLPAQASSVPLKDAGSLCTSRSDSNTNHGLLSSSSSATTSTSPSW